MTRWWSDLRAVVLIVMAFAVAAGHPYAVAVAGDVGHHVPTAIAEVGSTSAHDAHAMHDQARVHHAITHGIGEDDPADRAPPPHPDCENAGACCPAVEAATPVPTAERLAHRIDRAPPEAVDAPSRPRLPADRPPRRA